MNNISDIENLIREYAKSYYLGEPIATDEQFDALVNLLEAQDHSNPLLSTVGWGCRYGDKITLEFPFAKSLPKIKKAEEYSKQRLVSVSPKIDGMSVFIEYDENCNIKMMATREGVVITPKLFYMNGIPPKSMTPDTIVRGELYIPVSVFIEKLAQDFANPRNAVAGIVNRKSMELLEHVSFAAHGDIYGSVDASYYARKMIIDSISDDVLRKVYDDFCNYADYPIDGLVLDGLVAYKVSTEEAVAKVELLEWNLTDRKQLMPTVVLEDGIRLYGTKVKRATGIHATWIRDNGVDAGALVKVTKANEIIPQITEVMVKVPEVNIPTICPSCCGALSWEGVGLFCRNALCSYRHSLLVFMKTHFQCDGVKNTKDIIDALDIQSFDDIVNIRQNYRLADLTDRISEYPKIGLDKARKIAELLLYKQLNASDFLKSLGLRGVGDTFSKKAGKFLFMLEESHPIQSLTVMTSAASNVRDALKDNTDLILSVYNLFKQWIVDDYEPVSLNTMKVVLTGKMSEERKVIEQQLRRLGIEAVGSVTKDVSYLVQADPSSISSKTKTATKLGIPIISEEEMRRMFF